VVEYRDIPGFPGYRVGNDGSVWSCRNVAGWGTLTDTWHKLSGLKTTKAGHTRVDLMDGKTRHLRYVHRLVLEAFVGPCPPGMEVCHNDGNPANNRLDNLRWDTHRENMRDRFKHGTVRLGVNHHKAKLNPEIVRSIRTATGVTQRQLGLTYGVPQSTIWKILNRRVWAHVT